MIQGRFRRAWQENRNVPPPAAAAFRVRRGAAVPHSDNKDKVIVHNIDST